MTSIQSPSWTQMKNEQKRNGQHVRKRDRADKFGDGSESTSALTPGNIAVSAMILMTLSAETACQAASDLQTKP